jgi:hypothetical protein
MINEIRNQLKNIIGKKCWDAQNIITGTLELNFGKAIIQPILDSNIYVGQYDILIWCDWRLDYKNVALCSSHSDNETIARTVFELIGDSIVDIKVFSPMWDAVIFFSSGKSLNIFCVYTQDSNSLTNWDFGIQETNYFIGKGQQIKRGKRSIIPGIFIDPDTLPSIDLEKRVITVLTPLCSDCPTCGHPLVEKTIISNEDEKI